MRAHRVVCRWMAVGALIAAMLALTLPRATPVHAAPRITFEEMPPVPESLGKQYCNNPATNRGVEFHRGTARIFEPNPSTAPASSPTHALTNTYPGQEFGYNDVIELAFTAPQQFVQVMVGLDQTYNFNVIARISAYSSQTPSPTTLLKQSSTQLGNGPIPIKQLLQVTADPIWSVVVEFYGSGIGQFAYEVIDDLDYSTVGPVCINDTTPPAVQITEPAADGAVTNVATIDLAFKATDADSGVASIRIAYLQSVGAPVELEAVDYCGAQFVSACGWKMAGGQTVYDPKEVEGSFRAQIPPGAGVIRVTAVDFAGRSGDAVRTIVVSLPAPGTNLYLQGMEVTQAVQPWVATATQTRASAPPSFDHSAHPESTILVAGHATAVRLYPGVENTGGVPVIGARAFLSCFVDPSFFIPCPAPVGLQAPTTITVRSGDSLDQRRRDAALSWNFLLPPAWTTGPAVALGEGQAEIYLEARVEMPLGMGECNGCVDGANRMRMRLRFYQTMDFTQRVDLIGGDRVVGGTTNPLNMADATMNLDFLRLVYPVAEATVPLAAAVPRVLVQDDPGCDSYIDRAWELQQGPLGLLAIIVQPALQLLLRPTILLVSGTPCRGSASLNGHYGYAAINQEEDIAHELGHALELLHPGPAPVPTVHGDECARSSCESGWPWAHGTIGAFGYNPLTGRVFPPDTTEADAHDFMSYGGGPMWVSPRNWTRLYNTFAFRNVPVTAGDGPPADALAGAPPSDFPAWLAPGTSPAGAVLTQPARTGSAFWVRGTLDDDDTLTLKPIYELQFPIGPSGDTGAGEYAIDLRDASGQTVATRRFTPQAPHTDDPGVRATPEPRRFSLLIPAPDGVQVTAVVVRHERQVLATRTRTASAPVVTIQSPTATGFGESRTAPRVQWAANDRDNDPLYFRVEYSPGPSAAMRGQRDWIPLTSDVTDTQLSVLLEGLPGGAQAQVRVIATDGLNTTVAVSPAFAVADKPPAAAILSPEPGPLAVQIQQREALVLRGMGSDMEDGSLDGSRLTWRSSRDGQLGTGAQLEVRTLSPGLHTITLEARDSAGQIATASVSVAVLPVRNSQPVANAGPDQMARVGATVRFDGSGSYDEDGDPLSFVWRIITRPAGSDAEIKGADTPQPVFTPDRPGVYEVELRVYDGQVMSLPDRMALIVATQGP